MKLEVFDNTEVEEWQNIADLCDYGTFFHTPLWYEVFSKTFPDLKIVIKKFVFNDGKIAIFPLMERRIMKRLVKTYVSSPAECYGGWISKDTLQIDHIVMMFDWITKNIRNLTLCFNPLDENMSLIDTDSYKKLVDDPTEILYLETFEDEESLKKNYKHSVRKQINKAIKAGLNVKVSTSWTEWEQYFVLYQEVLKRWGYGSNPGYPIELFRNFHNLKSSKIKLWIATIEDKIIGGNLNFYHNKHCVEWHAAFDSEFFKFGVRNLLVHRIIVDALKRGYEFYDFNPSGGNEGTRKFKQTFGTTSVPANRIQKEDICRAFVMLSKMNQIVKKVIRKTS